MLWWAKRIRSSMGSEAMLREAVTLAGRFIILTEAQPISDNLIMRLRKPEQRLEEEGSL